MSEENIFLQALDWIYERALEKFGVLDSAYDLAQEYLKENDCDTQKAIDALIQKEALKSGGAGFLTGVGGFAALPVSLPANIRLNQILSERVSMDGISNTSFQKNLELIIYLRRRVIGEMIERGIR